MIAILACSVCCLTSEPESISLIWRRHHCLEGFQRRRIFIVLHLLWQEKSVFAVSPERLPRCSRLWRQARDIQDLFWPNTLATNHRFILKYIYLQGWDIQNSCRDVDCFKGVNISSMKIFNFWNFLNSSFYWILMF